MPRRRVENSERTQNRGGGMQASAATGVLARTSDGGCLEIGRFDGWVLRGPEGGTCVDFGSMWPTAGSLSFSLSPPKTLYWFYL